jgi:uncharacterized membrane protein
MTTTDIAAATAEEDRILRTWTPLLLRVILIFSAIILVAGIAQAILVAPDFYLRRFQAIQSGQLHVRESFAQLVDGMRQGDPHAIMTIGLYVLQLVPLVPVAFTFVLFRKVKDFGNFAATAYVLAGLVLGVMLGRVG